MKLSAAQFIGLGQLSLVSGLLLCFVLNPSFLLSSNQGGVSNYGLYASTVVPYSLAFIGAGVFTIMAGRALPRSLVGLRRSLILLGVIYIVILLSTYQYKVNNYVDLVHTLSALLLLLTEVGLAIWFALKLDRSRINVSVLGLLGLGVALTILTLTNQLHVLFIAESLSTLAFGLLLLRTVSILQPPQRRAEA